MGLRENSLLNIPQSKNTKFLEIYDEKAGQIFQVLVAAKERYEFIL